MAHKSVRPWPLTESYCSYIGHEILTQQQAQGWGAKVVKQLAQDLRQAFPEIKGLSERNLKYMRQFAEIWPEPEFVQQAVAQLPWGHHLVLMSKLPSIERIEQELASELRSGSLHEKNEGATE